jgi:peptidyl-tRNA hydrolase, PTH1 family
LQNYLIAGLGNIGDEYKDTRHNIGFFVLDAFALKEGLVFESARYSFKCEYKLKNKLIHFIKPTTFMNLSGKAVRYWMAKLDIPVENVLVIVDDIALPTGKLRLRSKGGHGGHNGLISVIEETASDNFARLRFGIGNDFPKGYQVDHVLGKWEPDEKKILEEKAALAMDIVKLFVLEGTERAMTRYNKN